LYNPARAKFQTNQTINPTTGNNTFINGLTSQILDQIIHPRANKVQNNKAATHNQTTAPINIFQKNDHKVTSFGALSNIATSGFPIDFGF
jgi:hypothetical protein